MLSIEEFNTGTLDPAWTLVFGALGSADLLAQSCPTGIYDLTTVPDHLAFQVENNQVAIRRDYVLADGKSVVMKLLPSINAASNLTNEISVGMSLTTTNAAPAGPSPTQNGYFQLIFNSTHDGWRLLGDHATQSGATNDASALSGGDEETPLVSADCYLRITRVGSSYLWFVSFNGLSWTPFKSAVTPPAIFTKLWAYAKSDLSTGSKILPVQLIEWIREFDSTEFDVR